MNVFMLSFPMNLSIGLILLILSSGWLMQVMKLRFDINQAQIDDSVHRIYRVKSRASPTPGIPSLPTLPTLSTP